MLSRFILIKLHQQTHQKGNIQFVINLILQIDVNDFPIK